MARMILKRPQPSRNSVSPLVKAAKPRLEPRLRLRNGLSLRLGLSPRLDVPAGGWRRFGGPPPASCGGRWHQIGDRTRRPGRIVCRYGCVRLRLNKRLSRSLRARLRRLRRPPGLPSGIKRHLPHLAHPILGDTSDHQRLVDPRLELVQGRNGPSGNHPVLSVVTHRLLDTRQFTIEEGGKPAL
jgi:hypothetical protein